MTELIDRKELMGRLNVFNDRVHGNEHFLYGIETAKELLEDMPTTTEAEIRAKAIDEFAERCKELVKQGELYDYVRWCNWNNSVFKWFDRVAEQLKEGE